MVSDNTVLSIKSVTFTACSALFCHLAWTTLPAHNSRTQLRSSAEDVNGRPKYFNKLIHIGSRERQVCFQSAKILPAEQTPRLNLQGTELVFIDSILMCLLCTPQIQ